MPPVATTESMTVDWGAGIFKHQDGAAGAISMEYGWGSYAVKHTRSGPLSLDMEVTITNDPKNKSHTSLLVPLCGVALQRAQGREEAEAVQARPEGEEEAARAR